jgi:hypothetical protein
MKKRLFIFIAIMAILAALPGCTPTEEEITIDTDFERTMGYVPASTLNEFDIWFIDQARAKQLYGLEDITSIEQVINSPEERREAFTGFGLDTSLSWPTWRIHELSPLIGFDGMLFDRLILTEGSPPDGFYITEADFDEELITGLLTDLGYTKTEYGSYSYYGIHEDYHFDLKDPLSQYVLGAMNRMAVLDNRVIFAPATEYVTDIFDTMSGTATSIMDTPASRALADSLGNVITAFITLPEHVLLDWHEKTVPTYYFDIPADWNMLHEYNMVAMGYRADGEQQYWDIALYYADADDAEADSTELATRMKSYLFRTWHPELDFFPLTDFYEVGEPQVQEYGDGAVLKISCRHIPEGIIGGSYAMGQINRPRDALFLAPDPSLYTE